MNRGAPLRRLPALALAAALAAAPAIPAAATTQAEANAGMRADGQIWGGLTALAIAREIGNRCPSIEARTFSGRAYVVTLYNRARSLGYSRAQIMAFVDDEGEKARLRREVTAWFAARGLREGSDPEGFCRVGRDEIAGGTLAGSFLRAR